jgi:uncharacterized membrane protein
MAAKSGTGLSKNVAGALSYVLGPITGVLFLVLEQDPFVKFHAMQSIVFSVVFFGLNMILGFTIVLVLLTPLVGILWFILWLLLIYKAWQGQEWELPVLGKVSRQLLGKM